MKKNRAEVTHRANRRLIGGGSEYTDGIKRNPIVSSFGIDQPYLSHHRTNVFRFRDAQVEPDEVGIPRNTYRWGGPYYYIVTIGHYGLEQLSKYKVKGEHEHLKKAETVGRWLVANQDACGGWQVPYDHDWFPGRTEIIEAPWYSAMGQGLAISTLARLHVLSGNRDYLEAISQAARPFGLLSTSGGVKAVFLGRHPWYEEYPTIPASFVLNGFMYALLGLWDGYVVTSDKRLMLLYREGIRSLQAMIPFFDLGDGTAYDLTHLALRDHPPNKARPGYHFIHVELLSALSLLNNAKFDAVVERWHLYLRGWRVRTN